MISNISHYRLVSLLGAGGMGEVYLAQDTKLDRKVAIKLLLAELMADEQAKKRLIREAKAAAKLDHSNICAIHEVGEDENGAFIVMQYVEGETLSAKIQNGPMKTKEALSIAVQVADALAEAHSHGIIHRDIKPQNIMITARGQAKVLDFGLAKTIRGTGRIDSDAETDILLTNPGVVIGTLPYMSPEQVRGEPLDARTDIFSLGAVIYQLVSGRQPFVAGNIAELTLAILTREPPPLGDHSRGVPGELQRIIIKALRKKREERYQSVENLLIDLKSLAEELALRTRAGRLVSPAQGIGESGTENVREPASHQKWVINYTQTDVDTIRKQIMETEAIKRRSLVLVFVIAMVVLAGLIAWLSTYVALSAASASRENKVQEENRALKSRADQIQQQLDAKMAKDNAEAAARADAQAKLDKLLPAVLQDDASGSEVASFAKMVYHLPGGRVELERKPPDVLFRNWKLSIGDDIEIYTLVGGLVDGKWVVYSCLVR